MLPAACADDPVALVSGREPKDVSHELLLLRARDSN
jgi:hypothetical protein